MVTKKQLWIILIIVGSILSLCAFTIIAAAFSTKSQYLKPINTPSAVVSTTQPPQAEASTTESRAPQPETTPAGPGLNQPARDGKFEFTVTKLEYGKSNVGGAYGKNAQGQFVLVTMTVKNISDVAYSFDASDQEALGANEVKYDADGLASIYANPNNETFINKINPGNQIKVVIVYDIPKGAKILALVLHDSMFSSGVRITV